MSKFGIEKRIRANLVRLRRASGYTQAGLAKASGVTHLAQIESGARPVGKGVLNKLARALDCEIYDFFLPENVAIVRDDESKLFLDMISACSEEGRTFIKDLLVKFIHYEKQRGMP